MRLCHHREGQKWLPGAHACRTSQEGNRSVRFRGGWEVACLKPGYRNRIRFLLLDYRDRSRRQPHQYRWGWLSLRNLSCHGEHWDVLIAAAVTYTFSFLSFALLVIYGVASNPIGVSEPLAIIGIALSVASVLNTLVLLRHRAHHISGFDHLYDIFLEVKMELQRSHQDERKLKRPLEDLYVLDYTPRLGDVSHYPDTDVPDRFCKLYDDFHTFTHLCCHFIFLAAARHTANDTKEQVVMPNGTSVYLGPLEAFLLFSSLEKVTVADQPQKLINKVLDISNNTDNAISNMDHGAVAIWRVRALHLRNTILSARMPR